MNEDIETIEVNPEPGTAVATLQPIDQPVSLAKLAQVVSVTDAQIIAKSAFVSKMYGTLQNEDEAFIKILAGQELGITPIAAIGGLYVYNGNVGMKAAIAGGLLKRAGYTWSMVWDDADNPTVCEITFYHNTIPGGSYVSRFTRADAVRAKLVKTDGAHEKYPKAMLFNRAFMDGARKIAPDVLLNFGYELDELRESTPAPRTESSFSPQTAPSAGSVAPIPATPIQPPAPSPAAPAPQAVAATLPSVDPDNAMAQKVADMAGTCPEHKVEWLMGKNKQSGRPQGYHSCGKDTAGKTIWCRRVDAIKSMAATVFPIIGFETSQDAAPWLKEKYGGKTWSQIEEDDQIIILTMIANGAK